MNHRQLTEHSVSNHGVLTTGSGSGMGSGYRKGKERLSKRQTLLSPREREQRLTIGPKL